ncbi:hypothetical protein CDO52_01195 [Nocardiopsis gilva YIM 90087]|uniref:Uncharacterized protein n=1 Tax=Nocardiopsis gilva YIM 90087 TaxID=1235441 RepID=A0A223S0D4_9ACTN|nr:hypothetical protein [Nocardiopsis gilva]ASU81591.1 hypothetical protein CDO52_01195 [Nocardiopsis gilva YIM 90087]
MTDESSGDAGRDGPVDAAPHAAAEDGPARERRETAEKEDKRRKSEEAENEEKAERDGRESDPDDTRDSGASGLGADERADRMFAVNNYFNGPVSAGDSTIGIAAGTGRPAAAKVTGRLSDAEVRTALRHIVHPAPYQQAREELRKAHLVVLTGDPGLGRRTGAISLIRDVTEGLVVVLSPSMSLHELTERSYTRGRGYIVLDWFGGQGHGPLQERDFHWKALRDRVTDAGAHLVITTTPRPGAPSAESVAHIPWRRPDTGHVLRERLGSGIADGGTDAAAASVPDECTMADLVEVANRLAQGEAPEAAVTEVFREADRQRIGQWFGGEHVEPPTSGHADDHDGGRQRSRDEIVEITALAFMLGMKQRDIEATALRLDAALAARMPPPVRPSTGCEAPQPPPPGQDVLPQRRIGRFSHDLVRVEHHHADGVRQRIPVFLEANDRVEVLRELWERFDVRFWDAVRTWIDTVIAEQRFRVPTAEGLATLAASALDEVAETYLEPWSRGAADWAGQITATYVLWVMCRDDRLAPVALRTAVRWTTEGTNEQQETGVLAWSGALGVRYLSEAIRRLMRIIVDASDPLRPAVHVPGPALGLDAAIALGALFGTLTDQEQSAGELLRRVEELLRSTRPHDRTRHRRTLALRAVLSVLTVESARNDAPAVALHIDRDPTVIPQVADLWAAVIVHRPVRRSAILALWETLCALRLLSADADKRSQALVASLAEALPRDEHEDFRAAFTTIARRPDEERPFAEHILAILLRAIGPSTSTA